MANVKITDLTELSAADSAAVDVFPIVDIDADATKKITIASLRTTVAAANDFVTYTNITANLDIVQDNVASQSTAIEARRVANIAGAVSSITTGNLTASRALISDGSGKVAISPVTSTEIGYVDGVTSAIQTQIDTKIATTDSASNDFITYTQLDANIDIVSANAAATETKRVANIAGAVSTILTSDLATGRAVITTSDAGKIAVSAVTSTELGYLDGVTSAIQTQINTKIATTDSAANDFVTFARLDANIDIVSANAAAVETKRVANIAGAVSTITTADLTASRALVSDSSGKVAISPVTSTELGYVDGVTSAIQTQIDTKISTADSASNDFITYTQLTANINLVQDNVVAASGAAGVEVRRVANIQGAVSTITTGNLTASRALVSDGSGKVAALASVTSTELAFLDATSSVQTQLDTKIATTTSASNDFVTFTRLDANIDVVSANATAVETKRVANIAGAVSSITTADLTASRAVVSDGSGKVAVSAVTATEVGYLDGVTSAVQTQIDSKQATITGAATTIDDADLTASRALVSDGSGKVAISDVTSTEIGYLDGVSSAIQTQLNTKAPLASPTFSGLVTAGHDLVVTGNLTVNGDTTTVNSENKIIQDRFIMLANAVSGAPSADVGIFFNRGNEGNAAIYYDESAKFFTLSETRDPDTNVAIFPTGAANLAVGHFTASSVKYNGADLNTAITDNRSGAVSTVYKDNLTASRAIVSDGSGKIAISDVTSTEIGYLDGVTSAIQTQINNTNTNLADNSSRVASNFSNTAAVEARRVANIAGAVSTITTGNLTVSRALVSDGSGKVAISDVTSTEIGYLDGVSSAIQTQLTAGVSNAAAVVTEAVGIEARRVANIAGAVSTITTGNLTASRALASDGSGKIAIASATTTELNQLNAITRGSIIYGNASGVTARLAAGGADKILTSDGTDISWEDADGGGMGYSVNTTIIDPPGSTDSDLGDVTNTGDAFGQRIHPAYDLMDPNGSIITTDLGAL